MFRDNSADFSSFSDADNFIDRSWTTNHDCGGHRKENLRNQSMWTSCKATKSSTKGKYMWRRELVAHVKMLFVLIIF